MVAGRFVGKSVAPGKVPRNAPAPRLGSCVAKVFASPGKSEAVPPRTGECQNADRVATNRDDDVARKHRARLAVGTVNTVETISRRASS